MNAKVKRHKLTSSWRAVCWVKEEDQLLFHRGDENSLDFNQSVIKRILYTRLLLFYLLYFYYNHIGALGVIVNYNPQFCTKKPAWKQGKNTQLWDDAFQRLFPGSSAAGWVGDFRGAAQSGWVTFPLCGTLPHTFCAQRTCSLNLAGLTC